MWKDFFFFSGSQRAGILVLFILIILVFFAGRWWLHTADDTPFITSDSLFASEIGLFEQSLRVSDSIGKLKYDRYPKPEYSYNSTYFKSDKPDVVGQRFPFDPNTMDSVGLLQLGIPRHITASILRFRRKGGYFYSASSFSEIYGLSPDLFKELEPYIRIENQRVVEMTVSTDELNLSDRILELNSADSSDLSHLKGISLGTVRSIIRFRRASGGFYQMEQLKEVYGMTDQQFAAISPYLTIDTARITKLRLNTASVDKLRAHPYLDFYQARAIYELRRRKGKLKSIYELKVLDEVDAITLEKMRNYLSFE